MEYTPNASTVPPSRQRRVNSSIYATNITEAFYAAASKIPAGTLVKDEYFTLFESVGALEIGDAKMDSGCFDESESIEHDFDVCKALQPLEIIWLMDELQSREVAWHMGYPLSQTLFTSVYIEKLLWPDPVELDEAVFSSQPKVQDSDPMLHRVFRSYCLGLIKSCDLVLGMVTSQHYYEEEDFAPQLYNRDLLHRFPVKDVLLELELGIEHICGIPLEDEVKQALDARLRFRSEFLSLLSSHTPQHEFQNVFQIDGMLLERIQASRSLQKELPEAFTLKIQKRLASTVPPRPMVTIEKTRTLAYMKQFIEDCGNVFSVLKVSHGQDLLASYTTFSSQEPQPSVYVRALMQSWLDENGQVARLEHVSTLMVEDVRTLTMAGSPALHALTKQEADLSSSSKLVREMLRAFLTKISSSYINIWRTVCLNRCRFRRTLCHAATEWDQVQAEAEELDEELHSMVHETPITYPVGGNATYSYSLSSWIYHYKLMQLRLIVQSGFELNVYAPHEMSQMYWYLGHLCDTHLGHLERISYFVSHKQANLRYQRLGKDEAADCQASLQCLYRHFSLLKAVEATARALHIVYLLLQRNGYFVQHDVTYASEQLRYELRMKPFLNLSIPEPLSFENQRRQWMMEVRTNSEIIDEATAYVVTAKRGWEEVVGLKWNAFPSKEDSGVTIIGDLWRENMRNTMKATIYTGVAVASLKRHLDTSLSPGLKDIHVRIPQIGDKDCLHPWWRVPSFDMSK